MSFKSKEKGMGYWILKVKGAKTTEDILAGYKGLIKELRSFAQGDWGSPLSEDLADYIKTVESSIALCEVQLKKEARPKSRAEKHADVF